MGCFTKSSWVIAFPGENVVYFCANSKPILCLMLYAGCVVAKICVVQCSHVVGYVNEVKDTLFIRTSNDQRVTECEQQQSKVKTLLLHRCALRKFHVKDD